MRTMVVRVDVEALNKGVIRKQMIRAIAIQIIPRTVLFFRIFIIFFLSD